MNDQDNSASGVRRVTPKDRKPSLSTGGLQFPSADDELPELPSEEERFPPLPPEPKRRGKSEPFPPDVAPPTPSPAPSPMTESEKRFPDLANFPGEASPLPFDEFEGAPPGATFQDFSTLRSGPFCSTTLSWSTPSAKPFERIILTCMAKDREERYLSANALADELETLLDGGRGALSTTAEFAIGAMKKLFGRKES